MILSTDLETLNKIMKAAHEERGKRVGFWRTFLNEFRGCRWRTGTGTKRSTNYVYTYADTYMRVLMFEEDAPKYKPRFLQMSRPIAEIMSAAVENVWQDIGFMDELRRAVFDSLYAFGVMKIGLAEVDIGTIDGIATDQSSLKPIARRVSPFDFVWDDSAKHPDLWQFCGEEFDRDFVMLQNDPRYDLSQIDPDTVELSDSQSEEWNGYKPEWQRDFRKELPKTCRLCELYLRSQNRIVTLLQMHANEWAVIRDNPYYGDRLNGPFYLLGFNFEGDQSIPISPAQAWWDQWQEMEGQERALLDQIKTEKTIVVFPKSAKESAKIIQEAQNYSVVTGVEDAGKQVTYGGATQQKIEAVGITRQQFEYSSGMSDIMRGQASRTEQTATAVSIQDRYSNIRTEGMRNTIIKYAMKVTDGLMWYCWYDPNVFTHAYYTDPATGEQLAMVMQGGTHIDPVTGEPDDSLDLPDFYLKLDADAFGRKNGPMERMQAIEDAQFLLTTANQAAMQQGLMFNVVDIITNMGKKMGWANLQGSLIPMTPIAQAMMMMSNAGQADPASVKGMANSGGNKGPLNQMPGGPMGGIMANVMTNGEANTTAGKRAAPLGQAQGSGN